MTPNILLLGANGFIGSNLIETIIKQNKNWYIYGMDIADHNLTPYLQDERLHFHKGDITREQSWIEEHIKKCDVVLPLVAIATPATYVQDPLRVFELDFEANIPIIRQCAHYKKRIIFPSTSEVYGMSADKEFKEEETNLVLGPVHKERWIYSCAKQLLDRVIYAHGQHRGLNFTLFRPFNWIGPRQDNILNSKAGGSRVLTQFISNVLHGKNIELVDGGAQRRCFTYIQDGIDALVKIIENANDGASNRIFNIGNPHNDHSIAELANFVVTKMQNYPEYAELARKTKIISTASKDYYGGGYQDVSARVPSVANAKKFLDWEPKVAMEDAVNKTLDYYFTGPNKVRLNN
jgi:nucleoside-diphosphate-sugar epimerase